MKTIKIKTLLFSVALLAVGAVAEFAAPPDLLSSQQWKLTQVNGQPVTNSKAFLELLNIGRTRFMGNTGCNQMFGVVNVRGHQIDFSNVGTTKMLCGQQNTNKIETAYVRALENVTRYRQAGNTLELFNRNRLVLQFIGIHKDYPQEPSRVRLEEKKWTLDAIKGMPVSRSGRTAFINFDAKKGSAGGNSSCNVFGGSYTTKGSTIAITEIISTMRACIEDDRMTIEREFLDGLRRANRYQIEKGKLMLYRDKRLLLTFNGENK